ncbi:MAG: phosphoenolpyruvate kinase [Phycisphaerae bacterium]|nr:phosphoenolpyruvate kinase [Phycisphaerae bacterium]
MQTTLSMSALGPILSSLSRANAAYSGVYPGEAIDRQPVQTVYGGAHLFRRDSARRLGDLALGSLREYAADAATFGRVIGLGGGASLVSAVYEAVKEKLAREPVEDFRIDFEDGYGVRPEAEEDACAVQAAGEVAAGMREGSLPPFIGIRIKNFGAETHARGIRTLDLFLTALSRQSGGRLPENFVVMLPKVVSAAQVATLIDLFEVFEGAGLFPKGSLKMEFMVETTQSVIDSSGRVPIPDFVRAARGRCVSVALGVYDYTASIGVTAGNQRIDHGACDFARHVMQVSLGGSGLYLSDGATNIMPAPPHKASDGLALTAAQAEENRAAVHGGWRLHFEHVRRSLSHGYYQGWDLNPAQLPTRYAAVYSFFKEALPGATERLRNFVDKVARATIAGGGVFDDAATAQGLLTFFIQGLRRRAITEEEVAATGLTAEEIRTRSFVEIVTSRGLLKNRG